MKITFTSKEARAARVEAAIAEINAYISSGGTLLGKHAVFMGHLKTYADPGNIPDIQAYLAVQIATNIVNPACEYGKHAKLDLMGQPGFKLTQSGVALALDETGKPCSDEAREFVLLTTTLDSGTDVEIDRIIAQGLHNLQLLNRTLDETGQPLIKTFMTAARRHNDHAIRRLVLDQDLSALEQAPWLAHYVFNKPRLNTDRLPIVGCNPGRNLCVHYSGRPGEDASESTMERVHLFTQANGKTGFDKEMYANGELNPNTPDSTDEFSIVAYALEDLSPQDIQALNRTLEQMGGASNLRKATDALPLVAFGNTLTMIQNSTGTDYSVSVASNAPLECKYLPCVMPTVFRAPSWLIENFERADTLASKMIEHSLAPLFLTAPNRPDSTLSANVDDLMEVATSTETDALAAIEAQWACEAVLAPKAFPDKKSYVFRLHSEHMTYYIACSGESMDRAGVTTHDTAKSAIQFLTDSTTDELQPPGPDETYLCPLAHLRVWVPHIRAVVDEINNPLQDVMRDSA